MSRRRRVSTCRRRWSSWLALACCGSLLSLAPVGPSRARAAAPAATSADGARQHHEAGRAHVGQGRFESAIAEYRKAYELRADPSYLLDIAEAYRALRVPEQAVFFYRRYLSAHPAPPNRPEIEGQIALLEPTSPLPPPTAPAPVFRRPGPDLQLAARGVSDDERGVVGRWWFWAAVGAVAATGATVAILAVGARDDGAPSTMLGNVKLF